jgi:subtilisin family serine protease
MLASGVEAQLPTRILRKNAEFSSTYPWIESSPFTVLARVSPRADLRELTARSGCELVGRVRSMPGLVVLEARRGVAFALKALRQAPGVVYAEPDYIVRPLRVPNDPMFSDQWGFANSGGAVEHWLGKAGADIRATQAWDFVRDASSTPVAVLDTGVEWAHPDLAGNIWTNPDEIPNNGIDDDNNGYIDDVRGWDWVQDDNDPNDTTDGHGTHCSGTIGAVTDNGIGVAGTAWSAKIVPLRFIGGANTISAAIMAFDYCIGKGIKLSSNSWGLYNYSQALFEAVQRTQAAGHLVVAAAGNNNLDMDQFPMYPAGFNLDNIVSVAAMNNRDERASFSNWGLINVDLGAPGDNIMSTYRGGYAYLSGTSMATPHVAGAAALLMSLRPTWNYQQIKGHILTTVRPVLSMAGLTVSGGALDLQAALFPFQSRADETPKIAVTLPGPNGIVRANFPTELRGIAWDHFDGDRGNLMAWRSDIQGSLGIGKQVTVSLIPGTHTITVVAPDLRAQLGSKTVVVEAVADAGLPSVPVGFDAKLAPGTRRVELTYSPGSGNTLWYEFARQRLSDNTWFNSGTVPPTRAEFQQDVPFNALFRYRVRAVNFVGASDWSDWVEVLQQ